MHPGQLSQIPTRSAPVHFVVMDIQKALMQPQLQSFTDLSRKHWSGNCTVPQSGRENTAQSRSSTGYLLSIILSRIFTWDMLENEQGYFIKDLSALVEHESGI